MKHLLDCQRLLTDPKCMQNSNEIYIKVLSKRSWKSKVNEALEFTLLFISLVCKFGHCNEKETFFNVVVSLQNVIGLFQA